MDKQHVPGFDILTKMANTTELQKTYAKLIQKAFPRTRVVIDDTEIYIVKPRTPTAQSITYSMNLKVLLE